MLLDILCFAYSLLYFIASRKEERDEWRGKELISFEASIKGLTKDGLKILFQQLSSFGSQKRRMLVKT